MSNAAITSAIHGVEEVFGGFAPGFTLVDGSVPDAVERYIVISKGGTPRLLLPQSHRAMRVALRQFLGDRPWIILAPPLVHLAARRRLFSSRVSQMSLKSQTGDTSKLHKFLCSVLSRDDFYLALRISFGRPNAKTVALAISHDGNPLCFAKIGSEAMTNALVQHEGNILERLSKKHLPVVMPHMLFSDVWEQGQHILITKPLHTKPLPNDAHMAHRAADLFTTANPMTSSTLRDSEYWHRISQRVDDLKGQNSGYEGLSSILVVIDNSWGSSILDFGASHGDWSRANLGIVGDRVAAFDWERFSEQSPRGTDTAHFAICEFTSQSDKPKLDIDQVAEKTRQYLTAAGLPPATAELLIILDCLEMSIRFMSAQKAGVKSDNSAFGQALQEGLKKWMP